MTASRQRKLSSKCLQLQMTTSEKKIKRDVTFSPKTCWDVRVMHARNLLRQVCSLLTCWAENHPQVQPNSAPRVANEIVLVPVLTSAQGGAVVGAGAQRA